MRQAIGSVPMLNIIMIFIVITFGFLAATLSYMKAFKVNSSIAKSLENYEGYNVLSDKEIANNLNTLGYKQGTPGSFVCEERNGVQPTQALTDKNHVYCLYELEHYENNGKKTNFFNYAIVTYIYLDLPGVNTIRIPIYSETEKIYEFGA